MLRDLLRDDERLARLSRGALEVAAHFSWDTTAEETRKVYEQSRVD